VGLKSFDRIEWSLLFPDFSAAEAARTRAAAGRIETARLPEDTGKWDWWPEHLGVDPVHKDIQPIIAGTTLTLSNSGVDWLELALCIVRETRQRLTVSATVEVACWCDPDHNMHVVRKDEHLVGTGTALASAFESAGSALERWAGGSHDPDAYRAAAGLEPASPTSRASGPGGAEAEDGVILKLA